MYFVAWTGSYILTWVLRGDIIDFTNYFPYLVAAWTGGGLEGLPQFMLILSIAIFVPLAVIFLLVLRRRHAQRHNAA
jgi:membrane protein implicated in regulation of membrane protease activity